MELQKSVQEKKNIKKRVKYYAKLMGLNEFLVDSQYSNADQNDDYNGEIHIMPELLDRLVEKFNELYISQRGSYLLQNHGVIKGNKSFITVYEKLTDSVVQDHLLGNHTIGCFPCNESKTKWFLFDVDVHLENQEALILAKGCTKKLIKTLRQFIPDEFIHCYRSGSKGYHVVVYLGGPFERQLIQQFQQQIIKLSDLANSKDYNIEIRPYTKGKSIGQTAKMPLGRNFTNIEYGSNFCCFVTLNHLEYKPAQYKYFLNIKPLSRKDFSKIIQQIGLKREQSYNSQDKDEKQFKYLNNVEQVAVLDFVKNFVITGYGQRHNMIFDIARKLRSLYGLSKEDTEACLLNWLNTQEGNYSTPKEKAIEDLLFQVDYVYSRGYEIRGRLVNSAFFDEFDMNFLASIVNNSGQIGRTEVNLMEVLASMMRQAKIFLNQEFFISYNEIIRMTGIVNRNQISSYLKRLEALEKIEVIERINFKQGKYKANTYQIKHKIENLEFGYEVQYNTRVNMLAMLKFFFSDEQLNHMLTKTLYHALKERSD